MKKLHFLKSRSTVAELGFTLLWLGVVLGFFTNIGLPVLFAGAMLAIWGLLSGNKAHVDAGVGSEESLSLRDLPRVHLVIFGLLEVIGFIALLLVLTRNLPISALIGIVAVGLAYAFWLRWRLGSMRKNSGSAGATP